MDNTINKQKPEKYEAPASMEFWDNFTDFATDQEGDFARLEVSLSIKTIDSKPWLILQTKDNGVQFNPNFYNRSPIDTEQPVAERQIGGLGIFLIEQSVDKATYEWIDNKNVYQLKMSC